MNNLTDDIAGCIAEDLTGSARNAPQFRELAASIVRDIKPDTVDGSAASRIQQLEAKVAELSNVDLQTLLSYEAGKKDGLEEAAKVADAVASEAELKRIAKHKAHAIFKGTHFAFAKTAANDIAQSIRDKK